MSYFYANANHEQIGPIEDIDLKNLFTQRLIDSDTLIWTATFDNWTCLKDTDIGRSFIKSQQKPVPPPPPAQYKKRETVNQNTSDGLMWVKDDKYGWIKMKLLSQDSVNKIFTLQHLQTNKTCKLHASNCFKVNSNDGVDDITSLLYIHEPGILSNLSLRYQQKLSYTFMSCVLIAVNPLRSLPSPNMNDFSQHTLNSDTFPPHPYAVAETVYQQLQFTKLNQSVIISGESGSGKTETAKIVLKYIVNRSHNATFNHNNGLDLKLLESMPILEAFGNSKTSKNHNSSRFGKFMKLIYSPASNNNTSGGYTLTNAIIETYLLEKSRIITQLPYEFNYHVFYQLLNGIQMTVNVNADSSDSFISHNFMSFVLEVYQSLNMSFHYTDFNILSSFRDYNSEYSDSSQFHGYDSLIAVIQSLYTCGFQPNELEDIFKVLLGILLLGNIAFDVEDTIEGVVSNIVSTSLSYVVLLLSANAFGFVPDDLLKLISTKSVYTRNEWFEKRLTQQQAVYTRDAIIKAIYHSIFLFIVNKINLNLKELTSELSSHVSRSRHNDLDKYIGILDIFGFESNHSMSTTDLDLDSNNCFNGLEQLFINYANEMLQQTFNQQIFDFELKLYQSENLETFLLSSESPHFNVSSQVFHDDSDAVDNQYFEKEGVFDVSSGCIELLTDKSCGIFTILDNISKNPSKNVNTSVDVKFCEELHRLFSVPTNNAPIDSKNGKSSYFGYVHPKNRRNTFIVNHFAGPVTYTTPSLEMVDLVDGMSWISKNIDNIPDTLTIICQQSTSAVVCSLSEYLYLNSANISPSAAGHSNAVDRNKPSLNTSANANISNKFSFQAKNSDSGQKSFHAVNASKPTLCSSFIQSMVYLTSTLASTTCQFIRCIKPFENLLPYLSGTLTNDEVLSFDPLFVLQQLRSLGVLQSCQVLKSGLPTRLSYTTLMDMFIKCFGIDQSLATNPLKSYEARIQSVLTKYSSSLNKDLSSQSDAVLMSCLFNASDISSSTYHLGRTMVFFKSTNQLTAVLSRFADDDSKAAKVLRFKEIQSKIESSISSLEFGLQQCQDFDQSMTNVKQSFKQCKDDQQRVVSSLKQSVETMKEKIRVSSKMTNSSLPMDPDAALQKFREDKIIIPDVIVSKMKACKHLSLQVSDEMLRVKSECLAIQSKVNTNDLSSNKLASNTSKSTSRDSQQLSDQLQWTLKEIESEVISPRGGTQEEYKELSSACNRYLHGIHNQLNAQVVQFKELAVNGIEGMIASHEEKYESFKRRYDRIYMELLKSFVFKCQAKGDGKAEYEAKCNECLKIFKDMNDLVEDMKASVNDSVHRFHHPDLSSDDAAYSEAISQGNELVTSFSAMLATINQYKEIIQQQYKSLLSPPVDSKDSIHSDSDKKAETNANVTSPKRSSTDEDSDDIMRMKNELKLLKDEIILLRKQAVDKGLLPRDFEYSVNSAMNILSSLSLSTTEAAEGTASRLSGRWQECFDKKTNKVYYINTVTKESSWKKPDFI